MIFFFSATGNSRFVASHLASLLHTEALDILNLQDDFIMPADNEEPVGFVFPIYCWGVPPVMQRFIEKILLRIDASRYLFTICSCGDEAGTAMRTLSRKISKTRGRGADAVFSVIMPNTYVLLPGFDVDSREVETRKLSEAPERIERIAEVLKSRQTGIYDVRQGSMPALRSMIFPVFEKWGVFPSKWNVSSACVGCGKCKAACPAHNISMVDDHPVWGSDCYSCCACFHICPVNAINYGSITRHKSQYFCPLK